MRYSPKYSPRSILITWGVLVAAAVRAREAAAQDTTSRATAGATVPTSSDTANPPHRPHMATATRLATDTAAARVQQYLMNPHGEVDGLLLQNGTQVKFPPHMGEAVVAAIRPNDAVRVRGEAGYNVPVIHAYSIENARSGKTLVDSGPMPGRRRAPPPLREQSMSKMSAEGRIAAPLYAPRGEVEGVVLDDKTIVRIAPPAAREFSTLLQKGQRLHATGYGTSNKYGRVLEAEAIGAPGQALTAIYNPGPRRPHHGPDDDSRQDPHRGPAGPQEGAGAPPPPARP